MRPLRFIVQFTRVTRFPAVLENKDQQDDNDDDQQRSATDVHVYASHTYELPDTPAGSTPTRSLTSQIPVDAIRVPSLTID